MAPNCQYAIKSVREYPLKFTTEIASESRMKFTLIMPSAAQLVRSKRTATSPMSKRREFTDEIYCVNSPI